MIFRVKQSFQKIGRLDSEGVLMLVSQVIEKEKLAEIHMKKKGRRGSYRLILALLKYSSEWMVGGTHTMERKWKRKKKMFASKMQLWLTYFLIRFI